ncbi:Acyl-CoA N-acyltransferase [Cordyceps fumosorosea ARSEF 2679]|uniref:Acyl-CoA N-acyltransferase n=1 Tax=Cordyceps fumosorosea (strain ARSEF 2679) TaxID=1081104 RepID=A0A167UC20_CORFA|nr:Acyl-CoA N-acyltransferase [Cordyceps fumosorosea ARSEF 2679]OAA61435.1 Acyl-CoA N-acyltransferase [Cordyceps fumosorosea ARSEF 2679]
MAHSASVVLFDAKEHSHVTPYLAAIHASCIRLDRTIATFLPPLSHEKLLSWWKGRIAEISEGNRVMFLLVDNLEPSGRIKGPDIMGAVMMFMPWSETGGFRCMVEKLLIHTNFRGRGGARLLMNALEAEALKQHRTMLLLDTETGSAAEAVYRKLGYTEVGKIPGYGISPTGELKGGTFFYKDLTKDYGE